MSTGPDDPLAVILMEAERNRRRERAASASAGSISTPASSGDATVGGLTGGTVVTTDASGRIPAGLIPAGSGNATYEHTQDTPAAVWTVPHNLGGRPSVIVTDGSGREVVAAVEYPSLNTVIVRFGRPTSGSAQLSM